MKIIAPIKDEIMIDDYIDAGADEFYGAIVDDRWKSEYGNYLEYNRRGGFDARANFTSWVQLSEIVSKCNRYNRSFFLAINAIRIVEPQIPILRQILLDYKGIGGKKVILSDWNIIDLVSDLDLQFTISSCTGIRNIWDANICRELGAERIIFPRDITLTDIKTIVTGVPNIEYEAFLSNSGCRFNDGNCLGIHGYRLGSFCDYCKHCKYDVLSTNGTNSENISIFENIIYRNNRKLKKACSLCSIYDLMGLVDSVKIVGRVANTRKILEDIKIASRNIKIAKMCESRLDYFSKMIKPVDSETRCKNFNNCYYATDMRMLMTVGNVDLEKAFKTFCDIEHVSDNETNIDYIGINVSECMDIEFKLYFNTFFTERDEHIAEHSMVEMIRSHDMLRAITKIDDRRRSSVVRFDVGLKNRTEKNISLLLAQLFKECSFIRNYKSQILDLSNMNTSSGVTFYSSLYFLGLIQNGSDIEALKFHYLTRKCDEPDKIGKNYSYNDKYYCDQLLKSGISELLEILRIIKKVLCSDAHLWMIGIDYFSNDLVKYKIYIKILNNVILNRLYHELYKIDKTRNLGESFEKVVNWLYAHEDLTTDGIALCLDNHGIWSLNLYEKLY